MDGRQLAPPALERRGFARRTPGADEPLARTRLRAGPELDVVDIADGGVRATTTSRLLPGTHVDVHVVTRVGRVLQRARVARASVTFVNAERLVYEVALCFDTPIDSAPARVVATPWRPDGTPAPGNAMPGGDDARPEPPTAATSMNPVDRDAGGMGIGQGRA